MRQAVASETIMKYCATCQKQTPQIRPRASNVLHLLMSVITLGLWLPVWFIIGLRNTSARPLCTVCGNDTMLGMKVEPTPWWASILAFLVLMVLFGLFFKN
jgi:hypothetical protein